MTDRWDRLAADLTEGGIHARLDRQPYQQIRYGRLEQGVSSSIWIKLPGRGGIQVKDKYGRGGKWYGWVAWLEDTESIVIRSQDRGVTKRSEIVQIVEGFMTAPMPRDGARR